MLRAHPPQDPPSVHIELRAGSVAVAGQQQEEQPARRPSGSSGQGGSESGSEVVRGAASAASLAALATDSQPSGAMADAAAAQLSSALQVWALHRLANIHGTACNWHEAMRNGRHALLAATVLC